MTHNEAEAEMPGNENSTITHDDSLPTTGNLKQRADWLRKRIDTSIGKAARRTLQNQRRATLIKVSTIVLAGTATILLGLQIPSLQDAFKNVAFVFGAIVTLLSATEPFFNYRALWVEHERAEYRFRLLKDDLDYYLAGTPVEKLSEAELKEFHATFQAIWTQLSESWLEQRQSSRYSL